MNIKQDILKLKPTLDTAGDITILFGPEHTLDVIAGALGLYLSLSSLGKRVTIASPKQITVEFNNLIGVNKITPTLGNKNFVISLDYNEESIEKVSYHIDNGKFNLVIEPRTNAPLISSDKVTYSYAGFSTDLIFVVGVQTLEELGSFYENNKAIFADKQVVNIDTRLTNRRFGQVNIIQNASSVSEIIFHLLKELAITLSADAATTLYAGIKDATKNFTTPTANADTFEAVAGLLRSGAKKEWGRRMDASGVDPSALFSHQRQQQQEERPEVETQSSGIENKGGTPPDWLKPKIFKGSGLL